jgi:hypothetical protein
MGWEFLTPSLLDASRAFCSYKNIFVVADDLLRLHDNAPKIRHWAKKWRVIGPTQGATLKPEWGFRYSLALL